MIYKKNIKIWKQLTQRDLALLKKIPILWLKYTLNKVTLFYLMHVISAMYGKVWQKSGISGKSGIYSVYSSDFLKGKYHFMYDYS